MNMNGIGFYRFFLFLEKVHFLKSVIQVGLLYIVEIMNGIGFL